MTIEKRMIELEEEIESIKEMSHLLATNIKNSELLLERMAKRLSQYEKEKQQAAMNHGELLHAFGIMNQQKQQGHEFIDDTPVDNLIKSTI
ncbi:hypothetical protein [Legionella longbeachae]|uniref:Putative coiled-coil protein n=1 Tax=Legionella longbeachae serogroup 1 (strain NSW150) TaxID=661367 RepID=D3HKT8_LEGLN|nr:hypothetical protein [Legionella longbeachae]VEE03567.1 coiled-coil protein [Legionella oakridgensis]HBD7397845.1 hypothetical protein [Legionella pneumophila]ARB93548.1 hypothetical protein A6J40_15820 [Legionella longbeachae]ARM33315.1 hypothetical protein B0B39_07155 [Legionella longbeachae]QEY52453.1 hypothetical protein FQU71_15150 [Legionella longbeachae]